LSAAASKESDAEAREKSTSEIEVLLLVSGLLLTPLLYLWQQSLGIWQSLGLPQWQAYLTSQLGSQYGFGDVIAGYFTPFALLKALPVDLVLWAYDFSVILAVFALLIFGTALAAIERYQVQRVGRLVERGRLCLNLTLLLIIFFVIFHLLTTTLFPFRLLLGAGDLWTIMGVALLTAIILKKLLNRMVKEILGPVNPQKAVK
jgi:hypothetical protein